MTFRQINRLETRLFLVFFYSYVGLGRDLVNLVHFRNFLKLELFISASQELPSSPLEGMFQFKGKGFTFFHPFLGSYIL